MTPPVLHLAPGLTIDAAATAVTKYAILAVSGAGKSNAAVVMAEEFHAAQIPWVAIDPKGDWWGIRSSGDGKRPGLDVPVFGGLHGDVPLEPTAGALIGNLIAERGLTCVLDVSEFDSRQDQWRFLADLGDTLLKRNRDALHLFLEEADEYLPQRTTEKGNLPRCLGVWSRVVRRGRQRGLGTTLITQRSAAVNKDVLTQADTLIAMRVTSPQDRKVILDWTRGQGVPAELVDSLPSLEDGEAWVWSPQRLKITQRVRFRRRATFDSGATPTVGTRRAPATLADVDLDVIKEQMADPIARAQADDPKLLQARIRELERELKSRPVERDIIVETVEVAVIPAGVRNELRRLRSMADEMGGPIARIDALLGDTPEGTGTTPKRTVGHDGRTRQQLCALTGYTWSGGFRNTLSALRTAGHIVGSNQETMRITDAGLEALDGYDPLPTGAELWSWWQAKLSKAEQRSADETCRVRCRWGDSNPHSWPSAVAPDARRTCMTSPPRSRTELRCCRTR